MIWLWLLGCREAVGGVDEDAVLACLATADERAPGVAIWRASSGGLAVVPTASGSDCLVADTAPGVAADDSAMCDHFGGADPADWVAYATVDTASITPRALDADALTCAEGEGGGWTCVIETGVLDETGRVDLVFADVDCVETGGGPFAYALGGEPGNLTVEGT